ncbi:MAG: acyl-ACP--UDP-N-acetylglucosamine O-acyltransferase [Candidatus Omnitrophica bacterium]|nr:acyl-ACP--UDP-N-acetylglucosamine O-acyltransferase [Candidatus Omnitrophota bacterium]
MGIHKTAMVDKAAEVDPSVEIGPGVIIEEKVKIGPGVKVGPYACIYKGTEIGEGTVIHAGAVIGNEPQDYNYDGSETFTKIGKNNVIREYVTIHRGTDKGSSTTVGDNNFLMVQSHIGHNCQIGNNVIIANSALLAGHVLVEDNVFISGNVVFHQFCRIGKLAMIGGFTGVNKDVPPYMLVRGPSTIRGLNLIGIRRARIKREALKELKEAYKLLFYSAVPEKEALKKIREDFTSEEALHLASFIEGSKRGICRYRYNREEYFEEPE